MSRRPFPTPPNQRIIKLYRKGLGRLLGRMLLLLTTTGRKTGLRHTTPLQYEEIDGAFYVGSSRGIQADWYRNLVANPHVEIEVKSRRLSAIAEPVTDVSRIADYLALRLRRHPLIVGRILAMEGLPSRPDRAQLEAYAKQLAMVILRPEAP